MSGNDEDLMKQQSEKQCGSHVPTEWKQCGSHVQQSGKQ